MLINLQYSQKFLCGTIGGRGGKNIWKERKSSRMVLLRVCLDKKSFKLVKCGKTTMLENTIGFIRKKEQEEDTLFDDLKPLS